MISLTACGQGWEMMHVEHGEDYANNRTAGSTIMWVQKSMMPAKDLKIEEAVEDVKEDLEEVVEETKEEEKPEEPVAEVIEAPPAISVPPEPPVVAVQAPVQAPVIDLSANDMNKLFRDVQAK